MTMSKLSQAFLERMKSMLPEKEYQEFLESYDRPRQYGLRVNTDKISCEEFEKIAPFEIKKIPWIANGYFYSGEEKPGHCAYYQAGLYYLQEPSAMTPASRIPIEPGDYCLDMCAAPGGKTTAVGDLLHGNGFLVTNDISGQRCKALLRNVELFGFTNAFLTNEEPLKLVPHFPAFFHKIILDAPCSGEGMFRKEEAMAADWTPEKSEELSEIQKNLLDQGIQMLRPDGMLLYSTCTFAPCENEENIAWILDRYPELELMEMEQAEGFSEGVPEWGDGNPELKKCIRLFPHKINGEGHFLALLHKKQSTESDEQTELNLNTERKTEKAAKKKNKKGTDKKTGMSSPTKEQKQLLTDFFTHMGISSIAGKSLTDYQTEVHGEKVYLLSVQPDSRLQGINFLRNGLFLGDLKKNRFEPSQPLALAIRKEECQNTIDLPVKDSRVTAYLKGESIQLEENEIDGKTGWALLTVDGYPLSFGKLVGQTLKNKYPIGFRI